MMIKPSTDSGVFQFECETEDEIAEAEHIRQAKKFDFKGRHYKVENMADGIDQGPIITYLVLASEEGAIV